MYSSEKAEGIPAKTQIGVGLRSSLVWKGLVSSYSCAVSFPLKGNRNSREAMLCFWSFLKPD